MPIRAVLAVAATIAALAPAAAQDIAQRPHIRTQGEATVSVEPDLAILRAGVTTESKNARAAGEANARAMSAVMAAAKSAGVADRDMQTSRYAIQPLYEGNRPGRNRIVGFEATNSLTLKLRATDKIGDAIDSLIAAGANTIGGIEFVVSEPSKPLDVARTQAVEDARRKAELYAKAAGVALGAPVVIVEQSAGMSPPAPAMMARSAAQETPVAAGERTLRVTVAVTFEIGR